MAHHHAVLIAAAAVGVAVAAGVGGYLGSIRIARGATAPPPQRSIVDIARASLAAARKAGRTGPADTACHDIDEDAARIFWLHGRLTGYHANSDA